MHSGRFHKMHGLGNDFVIVDAREHEFAPAPARAAAIADRRHGIGCDQLIVLEPSKTADLFMRIYNADGSQAETCGNATRCVVALLDRNLSIETAGGLIVGKPGNGDPAISMGAPKFAWDAIPLAYAMDTAAMPVGWGGLENPAAVNVGNPHIVFFLDDAGAVDLARLGPMIETDPLFPQRVNINVASIGSDGAVDLRVWERGAGLTSACGSGACATAVAAIRRGLVTSPVTLRLPGGALTIEWREGESIVMRGPASYVYSGQTDWARFG